MTEEQILSAIINYCQDDTLIFQVIIQSTTLHIYINRQDEAEVNHNQLKDNISLAISTLKNFDLDKIYLYSRTIGKLEPDWETTINCKQSNIIENLEPYKEQETPNNINYDSDNTLDEKYIILKTYCFIRNKNLLTSELLPPALNIAQLIRTFYQFDKLIQEEQLSILNDYFYKSQNPSLTNFNSEVKLWWDEVLELSLEQQRKIAIWLSRYCFAPEATILTIENIFAAKTSVEEAKEIKNLQPVIESELSSGSKYSQATSKQNNQASHHQSQNRHKIAVKTQAKFKVNYSSKINKYLPIIWLIITLSFLIVDLREPINVLPNTCENISTENKAYCSLAAQMIGIEPLNAVLTNLPEPLKEKDALVSEDMMSKGLLNCELYGNIAAGISLKEAASSKPPLLSTSTQEILPDFYVADVEQTNIKEGNPTVRTACFFYRVQKMAKKNDIKLLAIDQIDVAWPKIAYEPTEKIKSMRALNKSLRTYSFCSILGLNTLFTAIIIYSIAILGMAIRVDSIETICLASFILGMTRSILSFLPIIGFLIAIPIECIALGITSACVEGFEVDWNYGYPFVAATAMILIVSRSLLSMLFIGLLSSIFG